MQGRENDWLRDVGAEHGRMVGSRKRLAHLLCELKSPLFDVAFVWALTSTFSSLHGLILYNGMPECSMFGLENRLLTV